MHVHYLQEESLTVERGTMGWQRRGEEEHLAQRGETVTFAPGEMHRFWNAGDDELVCSGYVRPPDNIEYFLTQIFASTRERGQAPSPVRRDLFGLQRRFADAPEPVTRARPA